MNGQNEYKPRDYKREAKLSAVSGHVRRAASIAEAALSLRLVSMPDALKAARDELDRAIEKAAAE